MLSNTLPTLQKPRLWFGIAYAVLIIVGVLSLIPAPDIGGNDKSMHFITYFMLSAGFTTLVCQNRNLLLVVAGLISYGILLELLQSLTGYRTMESYDMLANSAGVLAGVCIRLTAIPQWFRNFELLITKS